MNPALLFYNYPLFMTIVSMSILPTITIFWCSFSTVFNRAIYPEYDIWRDDGLIIACSLNVVGIAVIIACCCILYGNKCDEVSNWIERDLFILFMEKRPLREKDETVQTAIWEEIARQLNLKIEKAHGIRNFYSRDSLISALNNTIDITSKSLKGFAPDDIVGRDKLVMMARRVKGKDIESTFPPEII